MTAQNIEQSRQHKFNWKIVIPAFAVIIILYFIASHLISIQYFEEPEIVYCRFEKELLNDTIPRHECGYLKIVSKDIEATNINDLLSLNFPVNCSQEFDALASCSGGTYHFTRFPLRAFCRVPPCEVDGVICGAFYIDYFGNSSYRLIYEDGMFTEPDLNSSDAIIAKLRECD